MNIFLTASGVLIGVLLVWAQLWASSYPKRDDNHRPWTVELGLVWTYVSVLLAMLSFGWSGYYYFTQRYDVPPVAMGLFIAAFLMTVLNVAQSLVSNLYKLIKGEPLADKLEGKRRCIYVYVIKSGAVILGFSIWLGMENLKATCPWELTTGIVGGLLALYGIYLTWWAFK